MNRRTAPILPGEVPEQWDFYFCRVDEAPASIAMNFWYRSRAPLAEAGTLYWCDLELLGPGADGMGDGADAEQLYPLEEAITAHATELRLHHVARLRNRGRWQLFFYGPAGAEIRLRQATGRVVPSDRRHKVGCKTDPDWSCYFDFLCPDEERWRWILDRRSVEALVDHGDPLTKPRRVDHWLDFSHAEGRDGFLAAVRRLGFELASVPMDARTDARLRYPARIHRVDSVELDDIHDTVMELKLLAEEHDGDYDGWETSLEKSVN